VSDQTRSPQQPRARSKAADRALTESIALPLAQWFQRSARPLPWRTTPRDPYRSLVSELMLQQTQVSRVLEKFQPFVRRFSTIHALAQAAESDVLAEWSGLGYYRRARLLHAAAKCVVENFAGRIPLDITELRSIPGVGRYTAGALASIVFDRPEPIVDGNVVRVLSRVHARNGAADEPSTIKWCWDHATIIASSSALPALTNEGMMELGATVCTPRNPRCEACPLRDLCVAHRTGRQSEIPRPKRAATRRTIQHASVLILDRRGRVLIEQRPARGLWASMWQTPTLEREGEEPITINDVADFLRIPWTDLIKPMQRFEHTTTHRIVQASVWKLESPALADLRAAAKDRNQSAYVEVEAALTLGLSNLQRRVIAEILPALPTTARIRSRSKPGYEALRNVLCGSSSKPAASPSSTLSPTPGKQAVS